MVKIKLVRTGKRNQPSYRLVVQEAKSKTGGRAIDNLGFYNPLTDPATIQIDAKKYTSWIKKGAQPTNTVRHLYNKYLSSDKPEKKTKGTTQP